VQALLHALLIWSREADARPVGDGYVVRYPWTWILLIWFVPAGLGLLGVLSVFEAMEFGRSPSYGVLGFVALLCVVARIVHYVVLTPSLWFDAETVQRQRGGRAIATVRWDQLIELRAGLGKYPDYRLKDQSGVVIRTSTYPSGIATFARTALQYTRPRAIDDRTRKCLELESIKGKLKAPSLRRAAATKEAAPAPEETPSFPKL
jgi:hypothetical protein